MSLDAVLDVIACPVCGAGVMLSEGVLRCDGGHAFDVARQGFVTLSRAGIRHPGDTAGMVDARQRVQSSGMFDDVSAALVTAVGPDALTVLDVGCGTAHHTAVVVDAAAGRRGVALDSSKPALRRAARAHPRIGAVGADVVEGLPVRDGVVDAVLVSFAPRNATEFARVLAPGGRVVVVTPGPGHLAEIAEPLGMLGIGADKQTRLEDAMAPVLSRTGTQTVTSTVTLDRAMAADLALMGPAGFHSSAEELAGRATVLPATTDATLEVVLTTFTRPSSPSETPL